MASMAGHVNNFIARRNALYPLNVINTDAIVEFVPEPGKYHLQEANGAVGKIRGDLVGVACSLLAGLSRVHVALLRFELNRLANLWRLQESL